ncbi:hypothetical protein CCR75_000191 [Bremia lactucae]|uniref:Uncharacterized protein n=1 Tax=Bremia lactucae TaxID=4779 RepID=A0A976IFB9_BRELC|nr:hypothetical protein CCR75_000191 [Bremia lactucae]
MTRMPNLRMIFRTKEKETARDSSPCRK